MKSLNFVLQKPRWQKKSFVLVLGRENVKLAFGSFEFHFEKEGSTHGGVKRSRFHCRGVLSPLSGQKKGLRLVRRKRLNLVSVKNVVIRR